MDNNYNNFNFIDDNDLRSPTADSQLENPNVNYNTLCNYNNNSCSMMNTNTSGNVTMSSQSYPTASSDLLYSLPQYTQQQTQQVQRPIYQQNIENNIQQQFFNTTQPISQNVSHFSSSLFDISQINHSEIYTFKIPRIKVNIIPTFPPMINTSQTKSFLKSLHLTFLSPKLSLSHLLFND